jgi:Icc protein
VIAQLSDPHGSRPALDAAVAAVLALRPLPDAVLVSGDLADAGATEEYARVRDSLAALPMPVHVLPGNHDDAGALCAAFELATTRASMRCGPVRLVTCDTSVPGTDGGRLDEEQLAWLDDELAADRVTPTLVAMHHPPILTGIPASDAIGLPRAERTTLAEVLARHPQVQLVVAGHVHRPIVGRLGKRPVFICPSVDLQVRLDFIEREAFGLVPEPPAIAVHVLVGDEVVTHLQPTGYRP